MVEQRDTFGGATETPIMEPAGGTSSMCETMSVETPATEVGRINRSRVGISLALGAFLGLLGALYWESLRDLSREWLDDPNYSHGFLVPFFSGWLVWQRRQQLAALRPDGS